MNRSRPRRAIQPTLAEQADRHVLYQAAVQAPEFEIEFFDTRYKALRGRKPWSMREDFCGTALLCAEWCKSHPRRSAIGVDLCAATLAWGRAHNIEAAGTSIARRTTLLQADVLTVQAPRVDLVCAMNFSYLVFKTRPLLRRYFENVRRGLNPGGVFMLDLLGGTATMDSCEEERELADHRAVYTWEHEKFNVINHDLLCHIHFSFDDGSRIDRAYTYDWRLWSVPELHELLLEAGFGKVHVFWEQFEEDTDDPKSEYLVGTGVYKEVTEQENQESWVTYIMAEA